MFDISYTFIVLMNLQALGRRPVMLGLLALFAIGSALCGAATSLNFLIAGRGSTTYAFLFYTLTC